MQKTAVELQQFKEIINPVMRDIEFRLKKLETAIENQLDEDNMQMIFPICRLPRKIPQS